MVSFKTLLVLGIITAFIIGGGVQFTRKAIDEAKSLKNDIQSSINPTSKPKTERIKSMTEKKLNDKTGGVNT